MIQSTNGKGTWLQTARSLPASARVMGLYVLAGRGSGKSRMLGRLIAMQDFLAGIPQLIIDPVGGTIDNFLDKLVQILQYIPQSEHSKFWQRIRYIDMSGKTEGVISPFPLYYKIGNERSLREVAERYPQVILKSNPSLLTAQVQGWPPLHKIGVYTGVILASLNLQITSAEDLLRHPEAWESRFTEAEYRYPEVAPAVAYFRDEYIPMREAERSRLTNPFFDKIFSFALDPHLKAMFGSNTLGIDWNEVVQGRQTVLLDFRSEHDAEIRRFKLLWVFSYLYEWIKARGRSPQPFGLIIDEFAHMTQKVFSGENPLAAELDEFINVYMRAHAIWFTAAHQELYQIDEQLRNTLLSLGTYIIGGTSSMKSARELADALFLRDPFRVKHYRPIFPPIPHWARYKPEAYEPLDEPVYMPLEEQTEIFANRIKKLGLFQFLLRPALAEGHIGSAVLPLSIRDVDRDEETGEYFFPEQPVLERIQSALAAQTGIPVARLLAEQEAHQNKDNHALSENGRPPNGSHSETHSVKQSPGMTSHPTLPAPRQVKRRQTLT